MSDYHELLINALERARNNNGMLFNGGKVEPTINEGRYTISPLNETLLSFHSDQQGYKSNAYMTFDYAKKLGVAVKSGEKSIAIEVPKSPTYKNNESGETITSSDWKKLPDGERGQYEKQENGTSKINLFNIEQTNLEQQNPEKYNSIMELSIRTAMYEDEADKKEQRHVFNEYLSVMNENLVKTRKGGSGVVAYDMFKDVLHLGVQGNYSSYEAYVSDVLRKLSEVTGSPSRLNRSSFYTEYSKRRTPESTVRKENIINDLSASNVFLHGGKSYSLSSATLSSISSLIKDIEDNPELANEIFHEMELSQRMLIKAETQKIKPSRETIAERIKEWNSKEASRNIPLSFSKVVILKDETDRYLLIAKPENGSTFCVEPSKGDTSLFFDLIKSDCSDDKKDLFRQQLAMKYYREVSGIAEHKESLSIPTIFYEDQPREHTDRIEKVNVFYSKQKDKAMIVATIDNHPQKCREISMWKYQCMWYADDREYYKTGLASEIYADVLRKSLSNDVAVGTVKSEQLAPAENVSQHPVQQEDAKEKEKEEAKEETVKVETKAVAAARLSPMLKQFYDLKGKHPDAILLFRCGDFYETYQEDAEKASKILGITLTRSDRTKDIEGKPLNMAAFPYHALDTYLPKLIRAGERVAICDQLDAPTKTTKQGIIEKATPGDKEEKKEIKEDREPEQRKGRGR